MSQASASLAGAHLPSRVIAHRRGGRARCRRGMVMMELVAAAAVLAILVALLCVAARDGRRAAWSAGSLANLHRFAAGTAAYAADNGERFWGFSWRGEDFCGQEGGCKKDHEAATAQALSILYKRGGRDDIAWIPNWLPNHLYSQLTLYEYLDERLPALWGVSPADRWRLAWAKDYEAFDNGDFAPYQPSPTNTNKRWPYSSSYPLPPAFFDAADPPHRVSHAGTHTFWSVPAGHSLAQPLVSAVAFPSQKVHLHEDAGWSFADRGGYFAMKPARVPLLLVDGGASVRTTADANEGWQPNEPAAPSPTTFKYIPSPWEMPTSTGEPSELVVGHYRFTRGGLAGRDFGPEIGGK